MFIIYQNLLTNDALSVNTTFEICTHVRDAVKMENNKNKLSGAHWET